MLSAPHVQKRRATIIEYALTALLLTAAFVAAVEVLTPL
jgi:Flp pilus assembly pilin Flp